MIPPFLRSQRLLFEVKAREELERGESESFSVSESFSFSESLSESIEEPIIRQDKTNAQLLFDQINSLGLVESFEDTKLEITSLFEEKNFEITQTGVNLVGREWEMWNDGSSEFLKLFVKGYGIKFKFWCILIYN